MRVKDYEKVSTLEPDDVMLIDGNRGVKSISPSDIRSQMISETTNEKYWNRVDAFCSGSIAPDTLRKRFYRGKDLGSTFTEKQKEAIRSWNFNDMFIGDFWRNGNVIFRIVDFNYWLKKGDTICNTPHINIVPDNNLYSAVMNDDHTTEGGYKGTKMYNELLEEARTTYKNFFGASNLLVHREAVTVAMSNGHASSFEWVDSDLILMNEYMVYGHGVHLPAGNGVSSPVNHTIDLNQLSMFNLWPAYQSSNRSAYWLRDIVSKTAFANVRGDGYANYANAGYPAGVRPVCGIIG